MSIRTRIIGCFFAILFLMLGVSLYQHRQSSRGHEKLSRINELYLPASTRLVSLKLDLHTFMEGMKRFHFQNEVNAGRSTLSRMARDLYPYVIRKQFRELSEILSRETTGPESLQFAALLKSTETAFEAMLQASTAATLQARSRDLESTLALLKEKVDQRMLGVSTEIQNDAKQALLSHLSLSLFVILFGAVLTLMAHKTLQALPMLVASMKKIVDGDFDQILNMPGTGTDEISKLGREYNRMISALKARDQKIAEQQTELLRSEKLTTVGQLSAEMVHEIRNPLNSISLNLDWLADELAGQDAEIIKSLQSISKEVQRLNQITESYLVRAKVPSQKNETSELNEVIREIVEFSREEDKSRSIRIEMEPHDRRLIVGVDKSKIKQALLNLIRNAREAMPCGGLIQISSRVMSNTVELEIRDNGHGMNPSTKRQTFHSFYTTKPNGTGLGLTVTKAIVEEAQGSIHCESKLGSGTAFLLRFPLLRVDAA